MATALWLQKAGRSVEPSHDTDERARQLASLGFKPLDALHLAFAEKAKSRWFVTTGDRLLRKAHERREQMHVEVAGPDHLPNLEENPE